MTYHLAKRLYEAHYPNSTDWFDGDFNLRGDGNYVTSDELIEELGEDFADLKYWVHKNSYAASGWMKENTVKMYEGESALEALAELYIAIHKAE